MPRAQLPEPQHVMLYGPVEPSEALDVRMRHDLHATLATLINLYGDLCRPPQRITTWPVDDVKLVAASLSAMLELLDTAALDPPGEPHYRALAGAMGHYLEALRMARRLGERCEHQTLIGYARSGQRVTDKLTDHEIFMRAANGDDADLIALMLHACKRTRKRFGDQLQKNGVSFDPPTVLEIYTYQPKGEKAA